LLVDAWRSTSDGICEENKRGGRIVTMDGIGSLVHVEQDTVWIASW
jgi:hypothetical protein